MSTPPRIWISTDTPKPGEVVRLRAQIRHPMETGMRIDAAGQPIPAHLVTRFEALLDDVLLTVWEPATAVAANPFIEFTFAARNSGVLRMRWIDDRGAVIEAERPITVG